MIIIIIIIIIIISRNNNRNNKEINIFLINSKTLFDVIYQTRTLLWEYFYSRIFTFQKNFFYCLNESLLNMIKNAFYFILKDLFLLKIFKFLP